MLGEKYTDKTLVGESEKTEVWRATRVDFGRLEAVKLLRETHRNNLPLRNRFLQSNSTWAGLNHSNIVKIFNVDKEMSAVITDYFEHNLASVIARGPAEESTICQFLRDALNGLDYLHRSGFLHLNFKPTNLFVDQQGSWKLSDGQCHQIGSNQQLSPPGGTWKYLSPELMDEDSPLGTGSDIYSLGFLALEFLVGPQFDEHFGGTSNTNFDSNMAWHNWHCNRSQENPLAREVCPYVSEPLARIIDGMTRKILANRLYRAPDVLQMLDQLEAEKMLAPGANRVANPNNVADTMTPTMPATPTDKTVCELMVLSGPLMGQVFAVGQNDFAIGGTAESVIDFDLQVYPGATNKSIRLAFRDNAWEVSSDSMFLVNSQLAERNKEIRSGDIVRFGTSGPDIQFTRIGSKPFSVTAVLANVKTSKSGAAARLAASFAPGPPTVHPAPSDSEGGVAPVAPEFANRDAAPVAPAATNGHGNFAPAPPAAPAPAGQLPGGGGRVTQVPAAHAAPIAPAAPYAPAAPAAPVAPAATYQTGYTNPNEGQQTAKPPGMLSRMMGKFSGNKKNVAASDASGTGPNDNGHNPHSAPSHSGAQSVAADGETKKGLSKDKQNLLAGLGTGLVGLIAFILVPTDGGAKAKDTELEKETATQQTVPDEETNQVTPELGAESTKDNEELAADEPELDSLNPGKK